MSYRLQSGPLALSRLRLKANPRKRLLIVSRVSIVSSAYGLPTRG